MRDLNHLIGADISASLTGDLATISGTQAGVQRVLRRLFTNPGDYVWHPDYGGGLPAKVGSLATPQELRALILQNMLLEPVVARTPAPAIEVTPIANGVFIGIGYTDSRTKEPVFRSFSITL